MAPVDSSIQSKLQGDSRAFQGQWTSRELVLPQGARLKWGLGTGLTQERQEGLGNSPGRNGQVKAMSRAAGHGRQGCTDRCKRWVFRLECNVRGFAEEDRLA